MSVSRTFTAVKSGDRLELTAPVAYRQHIAQAFGDGEEVAITLKHNPKRQGSQSMRYYRGVVIPDIADASGILDPDEYEAVHDALAWKFLKRADHPLFGTPRRQSTSKDAMSQEEMSAYIDKCITWAETSLPGCRVRRPNEIDDWGSIPDYQWTEAA